MAENTQNTKDFPQLERTKEKQNSKERKIRKETGVKGKKKVRKVVSQAKKKEHKPKLLGPDIFRWGGGLPREGVGAKKFGTSLETHAKRTFRRDIPGFCRDIPGAPEKFRVQFWSLVREGRNMCLGVPWQISSESVLHQCSPTVHRCIAKHSWSASAQGPPPKTFCTLSEPLFVLSFQHFSNMNSVSFAKVPYQGHPLASPQAPKNAQN